MNKPTPYEVFVVAKMLYGEQTCHPSNRYSLSFFIPIAIKKMEEVSEAIDEAFEPKEEIKAPNIYHDY